MNRMYALLAVTLCVPLVTPALADPYVPPVIQVNSQVRTVHLLLQSQSIEPGGNASHTDTAFGNGPYVMGFVDAVSGEEGTTANGNAAQDSRISQFHIRGNGNADGSATANVVDTSAAADAGSGMQIEFQVPVKAVFSLGGTIEATTEGLGGGGAATIWVTGTDSLGVPFVIIEMANAGTGADPVTFFHIQSVMDGTPITLSVGARSLVTTSGTGTVSGTSHFDFTLDFGDRDGDGLLDVWETDGIDVDDNGTVDIVLDSDPDHKDLFIELDAMAGVPVDTDAIDDVVMAFDTAPAGMIDNPNGQAGVVLHVMIDETDLERQTLIGSPWPGFFDSLKAVHFGSLADQQHSKKEDVKKAREKIFRYCLWADSLLTRADTLTAEYDTTTGRAEVPGDDFIVAAGYTALEAPLDAQRALAGTFMHELGHTLGLKHGGYDEINCKPNYLSVMNYSRQMPYPATAEDWVLDYSRTLLSTLDEGELWEPLGAGGPSDRVLYFNAAPDGQSPAWGIVWAHQVPINWNGDPVADVAPVAQDISRMRKKDPPSPNQVLHGSIDWNHLWYPVSGHGNFADGAGRDLGSIPTELDAADLRDFAAVTGFVSAVHPTLPAAAKFALFPATPNPFNPTTEIRFHLPHASRVELKVYDLRGRLVRSLEDGGLLVAGSHVRVWDGKDRRDQSLASGVYFYRLVAGDFRSTRAVTLLK
ncbi:MAG: T9SS type A sorting domain-containing protein [bacterium]|nr:T9SS type A sorting domain-containing protein [bacterium]